jgi:hypothetical protein
MYICVYMFTYTSATRSQQFLIACDLQVWHIEIYVYTYAYIHIQVQKLFDDTHTHTHIHTYRCKSFLTTSFRQFSIACHLRCLSTCVCVYCANTYSWTERLWYIYIYTHTHIYIYIMYVCMYVCVCLYWMKKIHIDGPSDFGMYHALYMYM